jgi:hypothetical protein
MPNTVSIAGQDFEIKPLTIGKASAWRKRFQAELDPILKGLANAQGTDLSDFSAIAKIIEVVQGSVMGAVDTLFDMLCEWSPEVAAQRAHIEANGLDSEVMAAFVEVIKVAYPFGSVVAALGLRGPKAPTPSKS